MKWRGQLFLLKLKIDGLFRTIAAQRVASGSFTQEAIDASDKDSRWRQAISGGTAAVDVSASGLVSDAQSFKRLAFLAHTGAHADYLIQFWAGQSLELRLQVSQFSGSGEFSAEQQYTVNLVSADGLPPPVLLTTPPYPVESIDALDAAQGELVSSTLRVALDTFSYAESLDVEATLVDGLLRSVLRSYEIPAEAMDVEAELVEGVLRVALHTYSVPTTAESLDATAELVAGELRVALITYDNWPAESLDVTAELVSGSLM